jgi:hypothetical protein
MKGLKPYNTGLKVWSGNHYYSQPPFKGKNWIVNPQKTRGDKLEGKEIIIFAKSKETAQRAINLIIGCLNLWKGENVVYPGDFEFLAHDVHETNNLPIHEKIKFSKGLTTTDIPIACLIAAKASYRLKYVYAISKYNFSIENCSVFRIDLEPFMSEHIPPSAYPDDQVRFCYAIIAAYSVLEELGFEIRASSQKPSMIKEEWNPEVKKDIEDRLNNAGINLNETLLWTIRGPKRKIELSRAPIIHSKEEWSRGMVRDSAVLLVNAIAYASWLRSSVAAHKIKEITTVVSPYDVINVQHLARRLLLESLGFWKYWEKQKTSNISLERDAQ